MNVHVPTFPDDDITRAYHHAATQNVLAALNPDVFFGYWSVCADGVDFGYGNTYPSLDGHQMSDALLWLGRADVVQANWAYVRGFQQADGRLPIAIFPAGKAVMPQVEDNGGLYAHWVPGDPLRALGSTTFIQNADVIYRHTHDDTWLAREVPAVNLAADYLAALTDADGRVRGAGYYVERPTRVEHDGVAQCHAADAFHRVAALNRLIGDTRAAERYESLGARIANYFRREFWLGDQFAEYVHPERGAIDSHGLTDVDWAAIATGVATRDQQTTLWPQLKDDARFRYGGMPTGIAALPDRYEDWEFLHPDRMDLAAMGRVWYLESWARARMGDGEGLVDALRRVCRAGERDGYYWRERYSPSGPAGARKYCEYPANLIRIVQRFLLGVDHELDGSVSIAPTVPQQFLEEGFGQRLAWRDRVLDYRITADGITGTYAGPAEQRVHLRLYGGGDATITLPSASPDQPIPFDVHWNE